MIYIIVLLLVLLIFGVTVVIIDSNRFVVREYTIKSDKVKDPVDFLFITDLHGREYGTGNLKLLRKIDSIKADFALVGGDVMVSRPGKSQDKGAHFINELSSRMPVYFAYGNHEQRAKDHPEKYGNLFTDFYNAVDNENVHFLENEQVKVRGVNLLGFSMGEAYYIKRKRPEMKAEYVSECVGKIDVEEYNILLAHDPEYIDAYSKSGVSMVLSGHFHGGMVRLPFLGGVISPRFVLFPKYSGGEYEVNGVKCIVSCGLGMHSIPLRFYNPSELSLIHIKND